jgi:hypothetical protein
MCQAYRDIPQETAAIIAAKGGTTNDWLWGEVNIYACSGFLCFCLTSCLFYNKKIFCVLKVVGILCKSNDTRGVNTFASQCTAKLSKTTLNDLVTALVDIPAVSMPTAHSRKA